jgi:hypothetical protein
MGRPRRADDLSWQAGTVNDAPAEDHDLEMLVDAWLPLPDVAARLGMDIGQVRRMLDENQLIGLRRGQPRVLYVPAALVEPELLPGLPGTITVLTDSGFSATETLRWLFTPDSSLPGTPVEALRANRKTEVRRRAQALAF